jgi:dihydroxyacid dehydratase/phosphogluconate dehydratase
VAPNGAVVKATSIASSLIDGQMVYRHTGPARVFVSESSAIEAIKSGQVESGDILVLIGIGPSGTGMEEIYQITSALKFLPWGKTVSVLTDGRFSGVSTGPCIGHIGPEALDDGPIGRVRDRDRIEIVLDLKRLEGKVNLVGTAESELDPAGAEKLLGSRPAHPELGPSKLLPDDTRLWALLQRASGGTWQGSTYDLSSLEKVISKGLRAQAAEADKDRPAE